jgi:LysR family transcriptional regulator, hydrogen peroxide-inducible genes activator
MTLQQLEYIVSVSKEQSFSKAAEKCFVTQPTLSMQVQKLEETIGATIFDRSKQPVVPTEIGKEVIAQALKVLMEGRRLQEIVSASKKQVSGELRVGIIPTIAPYLVPLFLMDFLRSNPAVNLILNEFPTEQIINHLKQDRIDVGILVTPLNDLQLQEQPLYYEPFVAYLSAGNELLKKEKIRPEEMDLSEIWLLNEGHCMQSQVLNLCYERKKQKLVPNFEYKAGSIETLRKMVEISNGATLLPILAIHELDGNQMQSIRYFEKPEPVREVSLITHRNFVKKSLIDVLSKSIKANIPVSMRDSSGKSVIDVRKESA